MLAFSSALAAGFRTFEIDVHGTRDGKLVVIHDATLDRTTTGYGPVREFSFDELQSFQLKGTERETVPLLIDVLSLFRDHGAQAIVEVKYGADTPEHEDLCAALACQIEASGMLPYTTISAFKWASLSTLRRISPRLGVTAVVAAKGVLERGGIKRVVRGAAELGAADIGIEWTAITAACSELVRRSGIRLGVWTPNGVEQLADLTRLGVDWIITDRPDVGRSIVEAEE